MDIRFESRDTFHVSGYSVETTYSSHEKDTGLLWEKYGDKLKSISENGSCLYGATWYTDKENEKYSYLLGIEKQDKTPIDKFATCVEIPAAYYTVATVPDNMTLFDAWVELFEKGLPSVGCDYKEGEKLFEFFNEHGVCEIWVPVVK